MLQIHSRSRILVVGQAPGSKVHESGVPFADASGKRLREWLGIPSEVFHDFQYVAILPIGLCSPGSGKSGGLPPRPECAPVWHEKLMRHLNKDLKLIIVIGQHVQAHYLPDAGPSATDIVRSWQKYWPNVVPLPHPSPRNNM